MVIRAIAFDGNGVLYYRGEDFVDAVAEHFVRQWAPGLDPDAVRASFRKAMNASFDGTYGKKDAIARFLKEWGVGDPAAQQDVEAKELEYSRRISLFPTESETLLELAARGYPMGMITNTFQSAGEKTRWFEELGLGCAVRTVVSSIDVGIAKPEPGIYLEFARRVGLEPAEIAFVGHEDYELAGARRAGMTTISFNCPAEMVADFHLSVFKDLLGIMELHGRAEA